MGDPEKVSDVNIRQEALERFKNVKVAKSLLDKLEKLAENEILKKRPRGPR